MPMLAPIITPIACESWSTPALTKPTVMTVVAVELCIRAVSPAPRAADFSLLLVIFSSTCSILLPASFSMPEFISVMP